MTTIFGIFVIIVGCICWIGQSLSLFFPTLAIKLGVLEPKEDMDDTFYLIDSKVLGVIDFGLTWILPISAILMLLEYRYWPIYALVGGGVFIYFSCFIILSRVILLKFGKKVGSANSRIAGYIASLLWIVASFGMIVLSIIEIYSL